MNRRGFFGKLFSGAAAVVAAAVLPSSATAESFLPTVLDPERALWVPGAKTFFIPDTKIAIKNIRPATLAEQKAVTGLRMLRVKHRGYELGSAGMDGSERQIELIDLVAERDFDRLRRVAFLGNVEVHFDDGTVAYNVGTHESLESARASAHGAHAQNQARVAKERRYNERFYPARIPRQPDRRSWTRHDLKKITDTGDALPVIMLTDN